MTSLQAMRSFEPYYHATNKLKNVKGPTSSISFSKSLTEILENIDPQKADISIKSDTLLQMASDGCGVLDEQASVTEQLRKINKNIESLFKENAEIKLQNSEFKSDLAILKAEHNKKCALQVISDLVDKFEEDFYKDKTQDKRTFKNALNSEHNAACEELKLQTKKPDIIDPAYAQLVLSKPRHKEMIAHYISKQADQSLYFELLKLKRKRNDFVHIDGDPRQREQTIKSAMQVSDARLRELLDRIMTLTNTEPPKSDQPNQS